MGARGDISHVADSHFQGGEIESGVARRSVEGVHEVGKGGV